MAKLIYHTAAGLMIMGNGKNGVLEMIPGRVKGVVGGAGGFRACRFGFTLSPWELF